MWLRHTPSYGGRPGASVVLAGPGADEVRGPRRINAVLTAVRGLLAFAVDQGEAPQGVMRQLYELADSRSLPAETVEEVLRLTHEELPADGTTQWSARTMAARVGISKDSVA